MTLRFAVLATFIAALPVSVDAPRDSTARHGQTRIEAMGGVGQFGIVTRGCNGNVISVVHRQLESGALVVEHESPDGVVVGVRGGQVRESQEARTVYPGYGAPYDVPGGSFTNRYVNPFAGYESPSAGMGLGYLRSDESFAGGLESRIRPVFTGHVRFGDRGGTSFALRYMEDVPLQSEGNVSMQLAFHPAPSVELSALAGIAGPYDGALVGLKGRFWLTPAAAAQVRLAVGGREQYSVSAGLTGRWPARR